MKSRLCIVVFLCGFVAILLAASVGPESRAAHPQDSDVLVRLFGGMAEVASVGALERAELYLHAGTGRKCSDCEHADGQGCYRPLLLRSFIEELHGQTAPGEHEHIRGDEEKELLPWFVIAARLNPHNVEAWRTGSYWFYRTRQPQRAEEFITQGIRRNRQDYRLYLDRGILYYRMRRYDDAIRDLKTARRLCPETADRSDDRTIRNYLKYSVEHADAASAGPHRPQPSSFPSDTD